MIIQIYNADFVTKSDFFLFWWWRFLFMLLYFVIYVGFYSCDTSEVKQHLIPPTLYYEKASSLHAAN